MADQKDQAYQDYLKGMKYKDIAEKYEVTINTVKSWKTRYKWSRGGVHTKEKSVHTKNKVRGAPKGSKNALGNKGGHGGPPGNKKALKHGFFSKYIPQETLEIMGMLDEKNPADLIWDQICIVYAAIIRAQQIMFVADQDDMAKEVKKEMYGEKMGGTEYEVQFAWDRHATFLNAQSRAQSEFRSLVKQFVDMAHQDDERRLRLEQMKLGIEKTKMEIEKIGDKDERPTEIVVRRWSNDKSSR